MNPDPINKTPKDYEVPFQVLATTDLDAAAHLSAEERAKIPVGGLMREETLLPTWELDAAPSPPG